MKFKDLNELNVNEQLANLIQMLDCFKREITNVRSSEMNRIDELLIGLITSLVYKADSLLVLIEEEKFVGVESLSRSIFEISAILSYILKGDQKTIIDKVAAYNMHLLLDSIKTYETLSKDSELGKKSRELVGVEQEKALEIVKERKIKYKDSIKEYTSKLKDPRKTYQWYTIFNRDITNFRGICRTLGYDWLAAYEIFYTTFSKGVHGSDGYNFFRVNSYESTNYTENGHEAYLDIGSLALSTTVIYLLKAFDNVAMYYTDKNIIDILKGDF